MSEEEEVYRLTKIEMDDDENFIIQIDNKEEIFLSKKEFDTMKDWYYLIAKHFLRFDIFNILEVFVELNVTQISKLVEQSKSTIARHLKSMEEDGIIVSRISSEAQKGKIPPKLYSINRKLFPLVKYITMDLLEISNKEEKSKTPIELIRLYEKQIKIYRSAIYQITKLMNFLNPLLNKFEEELDNIGKASKTHKKYFTGKLDPWFMQVYVSDKYHEKFSDLYFDFVKKGTKLLKEQNDDPEVKERAFVYFNAFMPLKAYFEIYQKMKKK